MRLHLSALRVHLAHCAAYPSVRRQFGLTFSRTGVPGIAAVPGGAQ
jgi:hypothetical protein